MNAREKKRFREAPETLKKSILVMQQKIQDSTEEIQNAPLTIEAEMGDGRYVTRANPALQEYRALVRDFSSALKAYKEITGEKETAEINRLEDLRSRFKVAK